MKAQLFTFALIWNPNEKEVKEGKKSELIIKPDYLLAKDQASAALLVARMIPDKYMDQVDQIDIVLNPF